MPCTMHMQIAPTDCNSTRDQEEEEEKEEKALRKWCADELERIHLLCVSCSSLCVFALLVFMPITKTHCSHVCVFP